MNEQELDARQEILEAHKARLRALELQSARKGVELDPSISIEIDALQEKIQHLDNEIKGNVGNIEVIQDEEREDYLHTLINVHYRRLRELELRAAKYGSFTPSETANEIEDIKIEIDELEKLLDNSVQKIQGHKDIKSTSVDIGIDSIRPLSVSIVYGLFIFSPVCLILSCITFLAVPALSPNIQTSNFYGPIALLLEFFLVIIGAFVFIRSKYKSLMDKKQSDIKSIRTNQKIVPSSED